MRLILSEAAMGMPVRLSVLATNPALEFYLRHGLRIFEETSERRFMATERGSGMDLCALTRDSIDLLAEL